MPANDVRVWVEEIDPPSVLRFTWKQEGSASEQAMERQVLERLNEIEGIVRCETTDKGLVVEIDPDGITRYNLAAEIRNVISPPDDREQPESKLVRVWAEDLSPTQTRITWGQFDDSEVDTEPANRRRVAAWLAVRSGVESASPDESGVLVRYDPETLDRSGVGDYVRAALRDEATLRSRADDMMRRATVYGNLARKLAMDDRVSPLPGAAQQAIASRTTGAGAANPALRAATRFIPGATLISRVQTLLPMLTELSQWSREADPEIVDSHLAAVGLDRATLREDTITAYEIKFYARDSASETAAVLGGRAADGARQAISAGKDMFASFREAVETANENRKTNAGERTANEQQEHLDEPSHPEDSSPTGQS